MRFVIFAIYLGIGAMFHAVFVGSQFDWQSAWTYGWLLGWPIMLVLGVVGFAFALMPLVFLWMGIDSFNEWRHRRKQKTA